MSALSPRCTIERSFSYTSHRIQTEVRSEIVNGFGEPRPCTPAALVTCWSVITPETGARISTMPEGWSRLVIAEHAKLLRRGLHIHFGLGFGVLRDLQIVQRDRALGIKELGALQLSARELFIRDRLLVVGKGAGNIRALHAQQHLAFFHRVAQARVDFDHAAGRQGNHRNGPGDVGSDGAGNPQLRSGAVLDRGRQRKLLGMIHLKNIGVLDTARPSAEAGSGVRIVCRLAAAAMTARPSRKRKRGIAMLCASHWMTSRPTARFNWLAASK